MRLYVHGNWSPEALLPVTRSGHDVAVLDASMTPEEVYQEVLVADAVLIQHLQESHDLGVVMGLALAFGKDIYVAPRGPPSRFLELGGVQVYNELEMALNDLLETFAEASEEQIDDDVELHGQGAGGDGGDPEQRGT